MMAKFSKAIGSSLAWLPKAGSNCQGMGATNMAE